MSVLRWGFWPEAETRLFGIALFLLLGFVLGQALEGRYRALDRSQAKVNEAWGKVESQILRRGEAAVRLQRITGDDTGGQITDAHDRATRAHTTNESIAAAREMDGVLGRFLARVDHDPRMAAIDSFRQVRVEVWAADRQLAIERLRYNEAARDFNSTRRTFPYSIFGPAFRTKPFFQVAREVEFPLLPRDTARVIGRGL